MTGRPSKVPWLWQQANYRVSQSICCNIAMTWMVLKHGSSFWVSTNRFGTFKARLTIWSLKSLPHFILSFLVVSLAILTFFQNAWAEMDTADPEFLHHDLVSDSRKMLAVRNRLNNSNMDKRVYEAYKRSSQRRYLWRVSSQDLYNWIDYRDMGHQHHAESLCPEIKVPVTRDLNLRGVSRSELMHQIGLLGLILLPRFVLQSFIPCWQEIRSPANICSLRNCGISSQQTQNWGQGSSS